MFKITNLLIFKKRTVWSKYVIFSTTQWSNQDHFSTLYSNKFKILCKVYHKWLHLWFYSLHRLQYSKKFSLISQLICVNNMLSWSKTVQIYVIWLHKFTSLLSNDILTLYHICTTATSNLYGYIGLWKTFY